MKEEYRELVRANIRKAINKAGSQKDLVNLMNRWVMNTEYMDTLIDEGNLSRAIKKGELPITWVIPMEKVTGVNRKHLHWIFMEK